MLASHSKPSSLSSRLNSTTVVLQIFDQDYARMLFRIFGYSVVRENRFQEYHWAMSFKFCDLTHTAEVVTPCKQTYVKLFAVCGNSLMTSNVCGNFLRIPSARKKKKKITLGDVQKNFDHYCSMRDS